MEEISFTIDRTTLKLDNFTNEELTGICKHLFLKWHNENYGSTVSYDILDKKINEGLAPIVNDLFGISKSVKKGKIFEHIIEETIRSQTKHKYINTSQIDHSGDGILVLESGQQCIIEMKNYTNVVPKSQIEKLKYDMRVSGMLYAIMFSTSPIQGKRSFEMETDGMYNIIYVGNYFDNDSYIHLAITMLEHIVTKDSVSFNKQQLLSLNESIETVSKLKNDFLVMEKVIRTNLDTFYISIREYESNIKTQINNIMTTLKSPDEIILEKYGSILLDRINADMIKCDYTLIEDMDLYYCKNNVRLFCIKVCKTSLTVTYIDPEIKFIIKERNLFMTLKLLLVLANAV